MGQTEKCPWFTSQTKAISKSLWVPTTKVKFKKHKTHSNDLIKIRYIDNKNREDICFSPKKLPKEKTIADITTNFENKKENLDINDIKYLTKLKTLETKHKKDLLTYGTVTKMRDIKLSFDDEQKEIIKSWLVECDKVYNYVIDMYNNKDEEFNMLYGKLKLIVFNRLYGNSPKPAPYDMLTDEVRVAISNIKSCLTNLKNGNITHYEMRHKNKYRCIRSVLITRHSISKNGICPVLLGIQPNFIDLFNRPDLPKHDKIISDCRMIYNKFTDEYYLKIPTYDQMKLDDNKISLVALDPGEKIFQTFYSHEKAGKIGENIRKQILEYQGKIKRTQRILSHDLNKRKQKIKNKGKLRHKVRNNYSKIKGLTADLRNKTALYLCHNFKNIIIPEFKTQKMIIKKEKEITRDEMKVISKTNKLNKKTKFVLNMMSHYKFRQHLQNKCLEYGCNLHVVTEEYTSQCCGLCGCLSKNYNGRIKTCDECNHKMHRDINGARNILLKNIDKYKIVRSGRPSQP